jgi:hypothetical protein
MLIIDRFEGDFAVAENGEARLDIPRSLLPVTAKEGDVLIKEGENYRIDAGLTAERRQRISEKIKKLKNR